MKTIRLEILRQGPPHNQLLSPLTEYLALCENHPAVPVRLPFEHAYLKRRMKALQYKDKEEYRSLDVDEVQRWMSSILAQVPGLSRELANQAGMKDETVHLRLTLSANELALLPFELASGSFVFGNAGESLVLQSQSPVCITREGRRVPTELLSWPPPPNPKILFAAAAPASHVPLREHLLALRQIIDPWVAHHSEGEERRKRVAEHLTVLPEATLQDIESKCATGEYTYVHILSHGIPYRQGDDQRFALALHDRTNPAVADIVDGKRLAKALRPPRLDGKRGFAKPVIVTISACDSGNLGDVTSAGASIAHEVHQEGVPLVVASQFPLSFAGSVIMAKVLYEGFFRGEDPRTLLVYLRRELLTQSPRTHDWASIVAYASFPEKFDDIVRNTKVEQTYRRFEAAFNHVDQWLRSTGCPTDKDMARVREARKQFDLLLEDDGESKRDDAKLYGIVASAEKRIAELQWRIVKGVRKPAEVPLAETIEVRDSLMSSRKFYEETFKRDRSQVWALVQVLALTAVLQRWHEEEQLSRARWELAQRFSEEELTLGNPQRLSWANANLLELCLLAPLVPGPAANLQKTIEEAKKCALRFRSVTESNSINLHSTRRQIARYRCFFAELNPQLEPAAMIADAVLELLPDSHTY